MTYADHRFAQNGHFWPVEIFVSYRYFRRPVEAAGLTFATRPDLLSGQSHG